MLGKTTPCWYQMRTSKPSRSVARSWRACNWIRHTPARPAGKSGERRYGPGMQHLQQRPLGQRPGCLHASRCPMQLGDSARKSFMHAMRISVMLLEPDSGGWTWSGITAQFPPLTDLPSVCLPIHRRTPRPGHYPVNFSPFVMTGTHQHSTIMLSHRCAQLCILLRPEFPGTPISPPPGHVPLDKVLTKDGHLDEPLRQS